MQNDVNAQTYEPQPAFTGSIHCLRPSLTWAPGVNAQFGRELSADNDATRAKERNPTYTQVYNFVQNSLQTGGALRAALFWEMFVRPEDEAIPGGITARPYGVSQWDNTFT